MSAMRSWAVCIIALGALAQSEAFSLGLLFGAGKSAPVVLRATNSKISFGNSLLCPPLPPAQRDGLGLLMAPKAAPAPEPEEKPKKPLSAYFLYAKDARAKVKADNPTLPNTEIVKKLGEQWRSLSAGEKKRYEDSAKKARDVYNAKYKTPAENKPKKPLSAYMIFANEVRPQVTKANPTAKFGDIAKIIGAKWQELTQAQKKPYSEKEKAGKAAFEAAAK